MVSISTTTIEPAVMMIVVRAPDPLVENKDLSIFDDYSNGAVIQKIDKI